MIELSRWLGLDRTRWERVDAHSPWTGAAVVVVTGALFALARFGGLVGTAPRAFLRLTLVTVWGWIGLATLLATLLASRRRPARIAFAVVGHAHVPLLVVSGIVLASGLMLELLGPGLIVGVVTLAGWLPASLVRGVSIVYRIGTWRAVALVAGPYAAWLAVVARHVGGQVEHLL